MRITSMLLGLALATAAVPVATAPVAQAADPSLVGVFGSPFEEAGPKCQQDAQGRTICKPAAVTSVGLPDNTVLYWDGLEGMEDVRFSTVLEIGNEAQDDVSRVLDLRGATPTWSVPCGRCAPRTPPTWPGTGWSPRPAGTSCGSATGHRGTSLSRPPLCPRPSHISSAT